MTKITKSVIAYTILHAEPCESSEEANVRIYESDSRFAYL